MFPILVSRTKNLGLGMDSSSSDEPIKYAPNRLGIALIAADDGGTTHVSEIVLTEHGQLRLSA